MIITTIKEPSYTKCDRCNKNEPFGSRYAPMTVACVKCHTLQKLCPDCIEKGCIVCHAPVSPVLH